MLYYTQYLYTVKIESFYESLAEAWREQWGDLFKANVRVALLSCVCKDCSILQYRATG